MQTAITGHCAAFLSTSSWTTCGPAEHGIPGCDSFLGEGPQAQSSVVLAGHIPREVEGKLLHALLSRSAGRHLQPTAGHAVNPAWSRRIPVLVPRRASLCLDSSQVSSLDDLQQKVCACSSLLLGVVERSCGPFRCRSQTYENTRYSVSHRSTVCRSCVLICHPG
jgi:hypothetical protein